MVKEREEQPDSDFELNQNNRRTTRLIPRALLPLMLRRAFWEHLFHLSSEQKAKLIEGVRSAINEQRQAEGLGAPIEPENSPDR